MKNAVFFLSGNNTVDLTFSVRGPDPAGLRSYEWPQELWSSVSSQLLDFWLLDVWWIFLYFNFRACLLLCSWNINECLTSLLHSAAWSLLHVVNMFVFQLTDIFLTKAVWMKRLEAAWSDRSLCWTESIVFIHFVMFCFKWTLHVIFVKVFGNLFS